MDEKTPTTDFVRRHYAKGPTAYRDDGSPARWPTAEDVTYCGAQFDRWLAEHDRVVAANAWDEGKKSADDYYWRCDDADAAGQGVMIFRPKNPYRIGGKNV